LARRKQPLTSMIPSNGFNSIEPHAIGSARCRKQQCWSDTRAFTKPFRARGQARSVCKSMFVDGAALLAAVRASGGQENQWAKERATPASILPRTDSCKGSKESRSARNAAEANCPRRKKLPPSAARTGSTRAREPSRYAPTRWRFWRNC
jgi:hypothetical protein